ncbi:MAG: tRNA (adenosine(37)-N6)-dimethylallyltransferase MiaA [Bacteroidales bacterium]
MKKSNKDKTLVVVTGPTAVGKTETSIHLAEKLQTEIISADARQFYRELYIGTAAPTPEDQKRVKHHFAGHLSIFDYYNASIFEKQALDVLCEIFRKSNYAILTGGSGLYIDTLCHGIDDIPDADHQIRAKVKEIYRKEGLKGLRILLKNYDPEFYAEVDIANPNRMMRGLEVFFATGQKYSQMRQKTQAERDFKIKKIILNRPRKELFERINLRTNQMVKSGLIEEAIRFFSYRHLNALNTVGYKELFSWMRNDYDLSTALEKIKTNTRRYAKRQLTWFKRYDDAVWFLPHEENAILTYINKEETD